VGKHTREKNKIIGKRNRINNKTEMKEKHKRNTESKKRRKKSIKSF